jgi:hypothetical protein
MKISSEDLEDLREAKSRLENPGLVARITNMIGTPIEKGFALLPAQWSDVVNHATQKALQTALDVAVTTMDGRGAQSTSDIVHKALVAVTGASGGAFGLPALPIELPVSTTVMLRSIADIARSQGEQIKLPTTKLACLEVFALGGSSKGDDAADIGYFAVRAALARAVSEATQYILEKGLAQKSAPALIRFITQVASRFGVTVSEKVAAQALPIIGAAGGAVINVMFIDHFQDMARGHFTVRRLERTYGPDLVRIEYDKLTV